MAHSSKLVGAFVKAIFVIVLSVRPMMWLGRNEDTSRVRSCVLLIVLTLPPAIAVLSTATGPLGSCSRAAGWRCAGHAQQFGSESLLPNLMEVKG